MSQQLSFSSCAHLVLDDSYQFCRECFRNRFLKQSESSNNVALN